MQMFFNVIISLLLAVSNCRLNFVFFYRSIPIHLSRGENISHFVRACKRDKAESWSQFRGEILLKEKEGKRFWLFVYIYMYCGTTAELFVNIQAAVFGRRYLF